MQCEKTVCCNVTDSENLQKVGHDWGMDPATGHFPFSR